MPNFYSENFPLPAKGTWLGWDWSYRREVAKMNQPDDAKKMVVVEKYAGLLAKTQDVAEQSALAQVIFEHESSLSEADQQIGNFLYELAQTIDDDIEILGKIFDHVAGRGILSAELSEKYALVLLAVQLQQEAGSLPRLKNFVYPRKRYI